MSRQTGKITIHNRFGQPLTWLLFMEVPESEDWRNVYQRSPIVQSGEFSKVEFVIDTAYYAIYGVSSNHGSPHVYTTNGQKVILGPDGSVVSFEIDSDGNPSWGQPVKGETTPKGAFIIKNGKFNTPLKYDTYIGIGAEDADDRDSIIPVFTTKPEPQKLNVFFPKPVYWICTFQKTDGGVTYGKPLEVNFEGDGPREAEFLFNDRAEYVDYEGISKKNGVTWVVKS